MMKSKVDFLFVYEVKNRELENICLLRYELEKRGYSVEFINTWEYLYKIPPKIETEVLLAFALYNDGVYSFVANYCNKFNKMINLQWEQVGTLRGKTNQQSCFHIKGISQNAVHLAWGRVTRERLISCGIDEKRIPITGHVGMDFLHEKMLSYYIPKEELLRLYGIPLNKKICLFISSFTSIDSPENRNSGLGEYMDALSKEFVSLDFDAFTTTGTLSRTVILEWISQVLNEREDIVFIYRPHPAEYLSNELNAMVKTSKNFFIIAEHSVKQWIVTCDIITIWCSTSLAEIFFAERKCHILRPVEIPDEVELEIYENASFITDYSGFKEIFNSNPICFPVSESLIREYYAQDEKLSHVKICDIFENVLKDDSFAVPAPLLKKQPLSIIIKQRLIATRLMEISTKVLKKRFRYFSAIHKKYYNDYTLQMKKRNGSTKKEVDTILNKIKACFENEVCV